MPDELEGRALPSQVYQEMTAKFAGITPSDLAEKLKSGQPRCENGIQWARLLLVVDGSISREPRGVWHLTDKGREGA